MIPLPLLLLASWFAAAPHGALRVEADHEGSACVARIGGKAMAPDKVAARPKGQRRTAIVTTHLDTPYKCIGATLFQLQRLGFRALVDGAIIVDAPEPLFVGRPDGIAVAERVYRACGIAALSIAPLGDGRARLVLGAEAVQQDALECGARWMSGNAEGLGLESVNSDQ